jgi:hypothetical protein
MCPSIEVDAKVFEVIKKNAEPFVDTPNTVLRRLLGVDRDKNRPVSPPATVIATERAAPGTLLPESEYELPILRFLQERGGRAPSREVVEAVGEALNHKLTDLDRQPLKSGDIRWENRVAFVRLRLIERGELTKGSPRGTWEITDQGRARLHADT